MNDCLHICIPLLGLESFMQQSNAFCDFEQVSLATLVSGLRYLMNIGIITQ